jgi:polyvinyl alcohol dehydrogenase (cytochrome)
MSKNKIFATISIAFGLSFFLNLPSYSFTSKISFPPTGEEIYKTKCAFCHNGTVKEAPRFEALQNLSSTDIIKALTSGIMKVQGSSLSSEEKDFVAKYISKIGSQEKTSMAGMCNDLKPKTLQNDKQKISNWGMGLSNQRFINDRNVLINAQNVGKLSLKWAFAFPEATCARSQPTVAGNTLFTSSQHGVIYAIDTKTGCIRWTFQAESEVRSAISIGFDKNNNANRLYFGDFKANVYALDVQTHQLIWKKKVELNEQAFITGSLTFYQNRLYVPVSSFEVISAFDPKYECCKFRGSVVALDATSGEEIWKTYTVDEPKPSMINSAGTQNFGPSGAPIWSCPTVDTKRGLLYVGTGENYSSPSSGTSDAIIALSLATGKIQWVKQTISQDAWNGACTMPNGANCPPNHGPDFDFGAPPILVSQKGQADLILAGQKSGMVYAMNPDKNGEILWQARVGRGGIMGGIHWGMASDEKTLFVPINDREAYAEDKDKPAFSGLHALNILDGKFIWSKILENKCGDAKWSCGSGLSAAITLANDVIFGGSLDGVFRAFSSKNGNILWEFDTKRDFEAVNGIKGFGGTIDSSGAIVVGNQVFINSGYAKFGEKAGNVLLCFEVKYPPLVRKP